MLKYYDTHHLEELELDLLYLRRLTGDLLLDRLRGGGVLLRGGDALKLNE